MLSLSFKVSKHFVYFCKACKGVGVVFEYSHHYADLTLVDDANEHIFVGVRIHSVHANFGNTVMQTVQKLFGKLVRVIGNNLELVTALNTAQTVVNNYVGNKEVSKGTNNGGNLHAVNKERNQHDACIHNKSDISDVLFGLKLFNQGRNTVCTATRTKALEHQREAKSRNNTRCNASKNNVKVLLVVCQTVGVCADRFIKTGNEGLHNHINAQNCAKLFVNKRAHQNKDRQIESDHQNGPADPILQQMVGDGSKTAYTTGSKSVAVLKEVIRGANNHACGDCI